MRKLWWAIVVFAHDYVLFGILHLTSPSFREHQRYVRVQNAHLDRTLHATPDPSCDYCRARQEWRDR